MSLPTSRFKLAHRIEQLDLTPDDWELFTDDENAQRAARDINDQIIESVNAGLDRRRVEVAVHAVMQRYASLGATDSEPLYCLRDVLDSVFGEVA